MNIITIFLEAGERWNQLSDEEKTSWKILAKELKENGSNALMVSEVNMPKETAVELSAGDF